MPLTQAVVSIVALTVVGYPAVRTGAMFPDIDVSTSVPYRRLMFSIPVLGILVAFYYQLQRAEWNVRSVVKLCVAIILGIVLGLVLRELASQILGKTKHRGRTHRGSTGLLTSVGLAGVVLWTFQGIKRGTIGMLLAPVAALYFFVGFLSHIVLDQRTARDGFRIRF
nr:metal-dependent hydrolase [Haloarchaeobius sp. HME9146]